MTTYPVALVTPGVSEPTRITTGPDGALWFTSLHEIGRITTTGVVSSFSSDGLDGLVAITSGPDGALCVQLSATGIGRITTAGVVTAFPVGIPLWQPVWTGGITVGPDGALWFTAEAPQVIGRITTSGVVTTISDPSIRVADRDYHGPGRRRVVHEPDQ